MNSVQKQSVFPRKKNLLFLTHPTPMVLLDPLKKSPPWPLSVRRVMKRVRKCRITSGFIPLSIHSTHPVVDNCAQLAAGTMKDPKLSLCT
jgi:hypothetical protein